MDFQSVYIEKRVNYYNNERINLLINQNNVTNITKENNDYKRFIILIYCQYIVTPL